VTIFDDIYRENRWNGIESLSGPGSGDSATREPARALVALVEELSIQSVLDIGCGDGYWMPDLPGYIGCDLSAVAIEQARARHPERTYMVGIPYKYADLVIVRDVIQHLPLAEGHALVTHAWMAATPGWLLASTYVGGSNVDIAAGDAYSPDLTAPPFYLPVPDRVIFDGYHYHETPELRDERKHLGLWRVSPSATG
jgi:SAM-dependent methyltransferase